MADTTYAPLTYRKDGGDTFIIASGGNMDIESGGTWQIAGVTVTASAADLNTASGSATGTTNATWTVDSDSTGAKLAFDTNSATGNFTGSIVPPASIGANRTWTMQDASGTIAFTTDTSIDVDLGSSGTAGSLDIFPSSVTSGKLRFVATDNSGDDTITITNEDIGQATTITIPDPGTAAGEFVVTDTAFSALFTMNAADRAVSLSGDLTLSGDFTTTGAFNATFAIPSSSTWTFPSGGGTLATVTGSETGTTNASWTVDNDSPNVKMALDTNSATGNFTVSLVPAATISANRTITFADTSGTVMLLDNGGSQTVAGDFVITGTLNQQGNVSSSTGDPNWDMSGSTGTFLTCTGTNTFGGNVVISGSKTFATGTGAVSLAGDVTISGSKTLTTGTGAAVLKGSATFDTTKTLTFGSAAAGTATFLTAFSSTANRGAFIFKASDASTDHATTLQTNTAVSGGAATITLPNLTSTLSGIGLAETFAGIKTFSVEPVVLINDANNTSVTDMLQLTHTTSGASGAGIGAGVSVIIENDSDITTESSRVDFVTTSDGTKGSLDTDVRVSTMLNGTVRQVLAVDASDQSLTVGQNAVTDTDNVNKVRVYPTTQAKGSLTFQATDNTGDTHTIITNAAMGQESTITIPDPGDSADEFVLKDTSVTLTGKTIDGGSNTLANIARSSLATNALSKFTIPFSQIRNSDGTVPVAAPTTDEWGFTEGGFGNGAFVWIGEANATSDTKTHTMLFEFILPPNYVSSGGVNLVVKSRETIAAASTSTTIVAEVHELDGEGGVGLDLYNAFDVTDITESWTTSTAVITDAGLVAGDTLRVYVKITTNDGGGPANTVPQIGRVQMSCDIKG